MAEAGPEAVLSREGLNGLLQVLARDYRVIGPTVRDRAIVYDEIARHRRSAGRLDRRAGRRALPRSRGATTRRCSATPSGRIPGSVSCIPPRAAAVARARAARTAASTCGPSRAPEPPLRVHRRARLRPAGDRDPGSRVPRAAARRSALRGPPRGRVHRRGQLRRGGRHLLLRLDGHRPAAERGFDLALTELLDDGGHRFLVEVGSERGADVLAGCRTGAGDRAGPREAAAARSRAAAASMGREMPRRACATADGKPRASALGRRRRALPDLRQLHDGLPDLLLHDHRGRRPT